MTEPSEVETLRERIRGFEAVYQDLAAEEIVLRLQSNDQPGMLSADPLEVIRSVVDHGDFLDMGKAVPFEDVVEPPAAGPAQQWPGKRCNRCTARRDWVQIPPGDRPGGNEPPELPGQRALAHDMQRQSRPGPKHQHTSQRLGNRPRRG